MHCTSNTAFLTTCGYNAALQDCTHEKNIIFQAFRMSYVNEGVTSLPWAQNTILYNTFSLNCFGLLFSPNIIVRQKLLSSIYFLFKH